MDVHTIGFPKLGACNCCCLSLKYLFQTSARIVTAGKQKASKMVTARVRGRAEGNRTSRPTSALHVMGVDPPMSSVIVERHHPVTQVLGKQHYKHRNFKIKFANA